jgi:hypothetical protein
LAWKYFHRNFQTESEEKKKKRNGGEMTHALYAHMNQ